MLDKSAIPRDEDIPMASPQLPDNWEEMNGDEKYHCLVSDWASVENKTFDSPEIAEKYQRRAQRWLDVIAMKKPDRVPNLPCFYECVMEHAGIKSADQFYNPEEVVRSVHQFLDDFDCEFSVLRPYPSGRAFDLLGGKYFRWPGSSLPTGLPDETAMQYVEKEYMPADEYDELIGNPEGYLYRKYLSRICSELDGLSMMPGVFEMTQFLNAQYYLMSFAYDPLRKSLETLLKAADHTAAHFDVYLKGAAQLRRRFGVLEAFGGCVCTPYDMIGNTLRGTKAMMLDLYRRPDKIIAACEALVPISIQLAVDQVKASRNPFVVIYLHKGADGFMSPEQFEKVYWPTLKAQLLGLVDNGIFPVYHVQGEYNQRLDIIAESDLPAGKTAWWFEKTDMKAVKEKFGSWACIGGSVPAALFKTSTPTEMSDYCKKLIETIGVDGGYFLAPAASIDQAKPELVQAYQSSTQIYGRY